MTEYPDCCLECEQETKEFYPDPRTPPIDEHDCLCRACHLNVLRELAEEAATALEDFEEQISALEHKYRDMPMAEMLPLLRGEGPGGVALSGDFFKEVENRLKLATSVVAAALAYMDDGGPSDLDEALSLWQKDYGDHIEPT